MTPWLIIFVGLIYAYIGVENFVKGNYSVAIIFIGYAFSNGGLYMATKG